jgi:hypothetical protein
MNSKARKRAIVTAAAAALSLLTAGTAEAGSAAAQHAAGNSTTFPASPPSDPNAPAITSVVVSNDDKGMLTFQINLPNRSQLTGDMGISIYLDTDQNPNTGGGLNGSDYLIDLIGGSVDLGKWNGSSFDFSQRSPASLVYSYANGATISVNAGDIVQGLTAFNFFVGAVSGVGGTTDNPDFTNAHYDFAPAPGHGGFNYQIKITPLQLSVASFSTTPKQPAAGQPFTASMTVSATVPSALTQSASVTCTATIAGRPLRVRAQGFANGKAACSWQIPKSARTKVIKGSVSVLAQGLQASKSFSARVR